jgi:gamma-glutamylputrescine oxidase
MQAMTTPYPGSYYAEDTEPAPPRPAFSGTAKADVVVIGGGFTGLSAGLHLAEAGAKVVLLEAARVGFAASGRNGGQIQGGFRKHQRDLENWLGEQRARGLWALAEEAKALIRGRVAKHNIACALCDGVMLAAHSRRAARDLASDTEYLNQHYNYAQARTCSPEEINAVIGTNIYHGGRYDAGGGHLQPLAFALGLARAAEQAGAILHEESRVMALEDHNNGVMARLEFGIVTAPHAILACDAFMTGLVPELSPYLATIDSHIVATAPLPEHLRRSILTNNAAVADTRNVVDYYRMSADHRLLFAGGEYLWGAPENIAAFVRPHMLKVFPQLRDTPITHTWGGTVGITRTRMPHFGRVKARILFGYGYSGHGVALAMLGGKVLAESALGKSERFEMLASVPAKRFPGGEALREPLVATALLALKLKDML